MPEALPWLPLVVVLFAAGALLLHPTSAAEAGAYNPGPLDLHAQINPDESRSPQAQQEPQPPSPLLYLDIWLFGGLILLVMVVVGVKFLWKALQPDNRDPAEGLQPWEDPDYDHPEDDR
ncbi:MAG: hypothetical protein OXI91_07305 [Chloroflexota bacterium]|nr:hypothetical protein [Chloroflexota bacterium]